MRPATRRHGVMPPYVTPRKHLSNLHHLPRTVMRGKTREAKGEPTPNGVELPSMTERS